jgi:hypothetical protein
MNEYKRSSKMNEVPILFYLKSSLFLTSKVLIFLVTLNIVIGVCNNKFSFKSKMSDMLSSDLSKEVSESKFVNFGKTYLNKIQRDHLLTKRNTSVTQ